MTAYDLWKTTPPEPEYDAKWTYAEMCKIRDRFEEVFNYVADLASSKLPVERFSEAFEELCDLASITDPDYGQIPPDEDY